MVTTRKLKNWYSEAISLHLSRFYQSLLVPFNEHHQRPQLPPAIHLHPAQCTSCSLPRRANNDSAKGAQKRKRSLRRHGVAKTGIPASLASLFRRETVFSALEFQGARRVSRRIAGPRDPIGSQRSLAHIENCLGGKTLGRLAFYALNVHCEGAQAIGGLGDKAGNGHFPLLFLPPRRGAVLPCDDRDHPSSDRRTGAAVSRQRRR